MIKFLKSNFFIFFFIFLFFFMYVYFTEKNKGIILVDNNKKEKNNADNIAQTTFSNIEYEFVTNEGSLYILRGEKAEILKKDLNTIYLKNVYAFTKLSNNTLLKITSDESTFDKMQKNIFFYKNVLITNEDKNIQAENASFFNKRNIIEVFNNVRLKDNKNLINCDKLTYNMTTKNIYLKMNSEKKQIYGRRK